MRTLTPVLRHLGSARAPRLAVLAFAMLVAASSLVACAGDDTNPPAPAATDAGSDASKATDGSSGTDATSQTDSSSATDSATGTDSASADASGE